MMRLLSGVLALVVLSAPAAVLACPSCATREGPGTAVFATIAAMIGVPYVIAAITLRVFRKLGRDS